MTPTIFLGMVVYTVLVAFIIAMIVLYTQSTAVASINNVYFKKHQKITRYELSLGIDEYKRTMYLIIDTSRDNKVVFRNSDVRETQQQLILINAIDQQYSA